MAGASWTSWRVLLIAAMGEGLTPAERVVFKRLTGRDREPVERCEELLAIVGRRGGKSFAMAVLFYCLLGPPSSSYGHVLSSRGAAGRIVLCLPTAQQSRVVYGYCCAIIEVVPLLASLIRQEECVDAFADERRRYRNPGGELLVACAASRPSRSSPMKSAFGTTTAAPIPTFSKS